MTIAELSQKKFNSLSLIELSEQVEYFKTPVVEAPISVSDDYLAWWTARYNCLIPAELDISDLQSPRQALDLSVARNDRKGKEGKPNPTQVTPSAQVKQVSVPSPSRRRTRSTTHLSRAIQPLTSIPSAGPVTVEQLDSSSTSSPSRETESDEHIPLATPLASLKRRKVLPGGYYDDVAEKSPSAGSHFQDLSARRAMVSLVEENHEFDFSFLASGASPTVSSSNIPTGLEVATAKASLRHFQNINLDALGTMEKSTILSAMSILQSSPDFSSASPLHDVLNTLPSMFSAFQASSSSCSETLIQVRNFKGQKERLDSLLSERKTALSILHQKTAEFDAKEELVKKLETELAQHKADMVTLLHENEFVKASSDKLKIDIQCLGDDSINQKQAYQQWEDHLKAVEQTRAECLSKWEELRQFDLS
ncbi:uncharacterized protein LOC142550144 [Primulina tabacum]|uniref:uncharacterized protein LOC142550144 n=1 Tax=Primulina tabacum TaxID=48773 RepID=UPI003F5A6422